jgi:hypothetical protein
MDPYNILEIIVFIMLLISIFATIWTYLTYKKEQMQANLFLRYDYFRKSSIAFFIAIAIYIVMNSLDNLGIQIPIIYLVAKDLIVLVLVLISLYYFQAKVR